MASLDMTLDDMIKSRRNTQRGGRGQGRARRGRGGSFRGGRTTGAPRKVPLGVNARPSATRIAKSFRRTKNLPWQNGNGLFEDSLRAAGIPSGLESGTKVYVSNLDVGVTNSDIRELFSEIGELIRYAIHYDKNGRPSGAAEVVFARRSDAYQALKRYNNVQLDGKPMKIEVVAPPTDMPLSARVDVGRGNGRRTVVMMPGSARGRGSASAANRGSSQRGRGGFGTTSGRGRSRGRGGGRGRGRGGRGRKNGVEKSAEELDKELENYRATADAMQT
uniref:ALY protein n=1 Tax=Nicotiana benthamiana TaxID=4100 RepID=Q1MSG9_NICBE|nr:ALY protein [Nicotiana benthamiana]